MIPLSGGSSFRGETEGSIFRGILVDVNLYTQSWKRTLSYTLNYFTDSIFTRYKDTFFCLICTYFMIP